MEHTKLSAHIHFNLRNPAPLAHASSMPHLLKYWDLPTYKDTGLPFPQGVYVAFAEEHQSK